MSYKSKTFLLIGDFRLICLGLLGASLIWLVFTSARWFSSYYQISCIILLVAILFSKHRLFFIALLLFLIIKQSIWIFPVIDSQSFKECRNQPETIEALLNRSLTNQLLLSNLEIWCDKKFHRLASTTFKTTKSNSLRFYIGNKIKITNTQATYQNKNWRFESTKHTEFFQLKRSLLAKKRQPFWLELKQKSSYYLNGYAKQLYHGIALADRSTLSRKLKTTISNLGIFHLFAISGLHIGMIFLCFRLLLGKVVTLIFILLKRYNSIWLVVDSLALAAVWCYLWFIQFPITATRAWLMLSIWLAISHFIYWVPSVYILLLAALIIISLEPATIFTLGFQLSFSAVLAILIFIAAKSNFSSASNNPTRDVTFWIRAKSSKFIDLMLITIVINLFTLPITAIFFQKINLLTFLVNPIHILFMGIIYLPAVLVGFIAIPLGFETIYFFIIQKLGDFWYLLIELSNQWTKFSIIKWHNEVIDYSLWIIYSICCGIISLFFFKNQNRKNIWR